MKFVFLGTSQFGIRCAEAVIDSGNRVDAFFSLPEHALPENSAKISQFAELNDIPYHEIEDINTSDSIALLKGYSPDYIFVEWPRMLGLDVIKIPHLYCIGTHPTNIPYNRGRHPIHWLIVLGIKNSQLSFFNLDEGVDTGKVLLQIPFEVSDYNNIGEAMTKLYQLGYLGTKQLLDKLKKDPSFDGEKQDSSKGNVWRKRTFHDVTLDLRMSTSMILRIVQSFGLPYSGANLIFEKNVIKISKAVVFEPDMTKQDLQRMEQGKVLFVEKKAITVKADNGIVMLVSKDDLPESILSAKYIHPPSQYMEKWPEVFANFDQKEPKGRSRGSKEKKERIAIFGFKDALLGQFVEMSNVDEDFEIKYYISINQLDPIDIASEHKNRPNNKTEFVRNDKIFGKTIYSNIDYIEKLKSDGISKVFVLEDDLNQRAELISNLEVAKIDVLSFIHPSVYLGGYNDIESGVIIFPMCYIGYKADIGFGTIIQNNSIIEHHNKVGYCCDINPRVTTGGFTYIGNLVTAHIRTTIINGIRIGDNCMLGANSLVLRDCSEGMLYYGNPAKKIKQIKRSSFANPT